MSTTEESPAAPRFDELRALFVNCTLKRSPERSHTQGLVDRSVALMRTNGVEVDQIRAVDHDIATGVWPDMTEHGWERDEWPVLFERVLAADILVRCRWYPRLRQPAFGMGRRLPLQLRQPRLPVGTGRRPAVAGLPRGLGHAPEL